jgi:hypothetical protein
MKTLILTILLTTLCSCGDKKQVDAELQPYVYSVEDKILKYTGNPIRLNFGVELRDNLAIDHKGAVGRCIERPSFRVIYIDRDFFNQNKLDAIVIESVILHEAGHCLFGLEHTHDFIEKDGKSIPASIMYREATLVAVYMSEFEEYYYKELIKPYYF